MYYRLARTGCPEILDSNTSKEPHYVQSQLRHKGGTKVWVFRCPPMYISSFRSICCEKVEAILIFFLLFYDWRIVHISNYGQVSVALIFNKQFDNKKDG